MIGGTINLTADFTINVGNTGGTTISSSDVVTFNLNNGTFINSGKVQSSMSTSAATIIVNNTGNGTLTINGGTGASNSGEYAQTGSTKGATVFQSSTGSGNSINFVTGMRQIVSGGGAINITTPTLQLDNNATANVALAATGASAITIASPSGANLAVTLNSTSGVNSTPTISTTGGTITIQPAGTGTLTFGLGALTPAGTLNLNGGAVNLTTASGSSVPL
jgi:hypothetical protein